MSQEMKHSGDDWCGVPLHTLKKFNLTDLYPPVKPSESHAVLFTVPMKSGKVPDPYPSTPVDVWDKNHVRLPNSTQSLSPVSSTELRRRWDLIREAFSVPIRSSEELQAAILHYNSTYADKWLFLALHHFFDKTLQKEETEYFFENVLPGIVRLALSLPEVITGAIPLLQQRKTHSISLTQKQVACLLANAFLCTFPRRNTTKALSEYKNYPDINFNRLFTFGFDERCQEKLKCIINYFRRVCGNCPDGVVTYSRHYVSANNLPMWSNSSALLPDLHVTSVGTIEDQGTGMMEIDFANKFVGGGVLGRGSVQEEIRFVICPELIIARLFTESLDETEALIVTGVERYNNYKGYANSFTWAGDMKDKTPRDGYGRRGCVIVAIDAVQFQQVDKQYSPESMNRELNKAYAGFSWGMSSGGKRGKMNIATGNWGCGAFCGNPQFKSLLQLMVAGEVGRSVAYFTFSDPELRDKLGEIHKFLVNKKVSVGRLWRLLSRYQTRALKKYDVFTYLFKTITNSTVTSNIPPKSSDDKVEPMSVDLDNADNCDACGVLSTQEINAALADFENDEDFDDLNGKQSTSRIDKQDIGESNFKTEPIAAKSYSVVSKEGRGLCLQKQKNSWARIEESKKDFTEFSIDDDDSVSESVDVSKTSSKKEKRDSAKQSPAAVKRKISDYFSSSPKT